ncbi:MAG: hypothetical protein ACRDI2_08765 [Chloroflexota bacterium]
MSDATVDVIVFAGPTGPSAPERLMAGAQTANALDLVELALACPLVGRVLVATTEADLAAELISDRRVIVDRDDGAVPFHFGRRLLDVVERYGVDRPLYFGANSAPLFSADALRDLCGRLLAAERTVIANTVRSANFFGFTPAAALRRVELPVDQDNVLPTLLARLGGLQIEALEPTYECLFDVDTPADLAVLKLQGSAKPHVRRYLDAAGLDSSRYEAVMPLLVARHADLTLVGRVATQIWGKVPSDIVPGYKRLYVEERGMKASGREARGEVRSLIGHLLEVAGPERLFAFLAGFSDAIFFDTRVLFHHLHLGLSTADRFASDLGDVHGIQDPTARAFTAAALACDEPVILGGQNVVASGLWALAQEAWNRADAGLLPPEA